MMPSACHCFFGTPYDRFQGFRFRDRSISHEGIVISLRPLNKLNNIAWVATTAAATTTTTTAAATSHTDDAHGFSCQEPPI